MAWVTSVERRDGTGKLQPTQLTAYAKVFETETSKIVQIDTFGSDDRKLPGKQSQTLQFGREAAEQLYLILKAAYKFES
jgi:hypothetical protein